MDERDLDLMRQELEKTRQVLAQFIMWTASSAASPISQREAVMLLDQMSVLPPAPAAQGKAE